jgi:hypothetical protein
LTPFDVVHEPCRQNSREAERAKAWAREKAMKKAPLRPVRA